MTRMTSTENRKRSRHRGPSFLLGLLAVAACSDPTSFKPTTTQITEEETCGASPDWAGLGKTPPQLMFQPLPHPDAECPFYRGGWHNFLLAAEPDSETGEPAIKFFPTIDDVFEPSHPLAAGALAPAGQPKGTSKRSWLGDIKQAGKREILIDQNGHTIYYGIHVNQGFVDFVDQHGLRTARAVHDADPRLFFPAGVVEYKTAWQRVDSVSASNADGWQDPELENYVATRAWVPHITQITNAKGEKEIVEDRNNPEQVWVRLLAIHSVYTFPGHPEFIWASMEHTDHLPGMPDDVNAAQALAQRNVAPLDPRDVNPSEEDPFNSMTDISPTHGGLLFKDGTKLKDANRPIAEKDMTFDVAAQKFGQSTSVYRMFPASKSNTVHPDDAITSLNFNVQTLFAERERDGLLHPRDKRGHYRLVGGQWLDKPRYFALNSSLQNDNTSPLLQDPMSATYKTASKGDFQDGDRQAILDADEPMQAELQKVNGNKALLDYVRNGGDSAFSITAGEDRMSSTAMESFTQQPGSFQNCFACHNTQAINSNGVPCNKDPSGIKLLDPKLLNVSHVLSQFLLEECTGPSPRPSFCSDTCK